MSQSPDHYVAPDAVVAAIRETFGQDRQNSLFTRPQLFELVNRRLGEWPLGKKLQQRLEVNFGNVLYGLWQDGWIDRFRIALPIDHDWDVKPFACLDRDDLDLSNQRFTFGGHSRDDEVENLVVPTEHALKWDSEQLARRPNFDAMDSFSQTAFATFLRELHDDPERRSRDYFNDQRRVTPDECPIPRGRWEEVLMLKPNQEPKPPRSDWRVSMPEWRFDWLVQGMRLAHLYLQLIQSAPQEAASWRFEEHSPCGWPATVAVDGARVRHVFPTRPVGADFAEVAATEMRDSPGIQRFLFY